MYCKSLFSDKHYSPLAHDQEPLRKHRLANMHTTTMCLAWTTWTVNVLLALLQVIITLKNKKHFADVQSNHLRKNVQAANKY